jgi:hypothetical protein
VEVQFKNETVKIADKVSWSVLSKIINAQGKTNLGDAQTEIVVGLCIAPKFTYESIQKIDGIEILELGTRISKKLGIDKLLSEFTERMEDLKQEEDNV